MNVTLRQLRIFQAVVAERNFSRAGALIGLTQPAVSRAVTELEAQLGVRLLDRTTREVEPTRAGRTLAGHLDRLLEEFESALLDVQGGGRRRGRVRVASSPTLSASLMPLCIAEALRSAPALDIVLLDRIQQDVLDNVRSGAVDFGVVIDPADAGDLHCETIFREPFVLVCPVGHPLARDATTPWEALADWPLVLLDHASGSRRLIDEALARHGVVARVAQELGHPTTVLHMVEAGIGVSVMPALAISGHFPPQLAARRLLPQIDRSIMLVHRRNRTLPPAAEEAWQLVRRVAATMPSFEAATSKPPLTP
jgi:DNA-binding transcriptional LysR family regulator